MIGRENESTRQAWLKDRLSNLPNGLRVLDAGAGELRNKPLCAHLQYVSQDYCQYEGQGDGVGLQTGSWNTAKIDLVCDVAAIPEPSSSFDAILCSEVFEHLPDPIPALREFSRLLRPSGKLLITAPFCSLTHFAPYHYASGFNRYWYEKHLGDLGFSIVEMTPNGDWFSYIAQELWRIKAVGRRYSNPALGWLGVAASTPLIAILSALSRLDRGSSELLCYGWHVIAEKL